MLIVVDSSFVRVNHPVRSVVSGSHFSHFELDLNLSGSSYVRMCAKISHRGMILDWYFSNNGSPREILVCFGFVLKIKLTYSDLKSLV